jgi:hypothetical protein
MKTKPLLFLFVFFVSTIGIASADLIIDGSTTGYYNSSLGQVLDGTSILFPIANSAGGDPTINPASEPNLSAAAAVLGNWLSAPGSLNGNWVGPQAIPSTWAINTETAIVYGFDAGAGLQNLVGKFGVDNGVFVWLDGAYISGALAPGGASMWEYIYDLGNLSAGTHYLQILREDHGGSTGWYVEVSGKSVPEPTTVLLLGAGLIGLAGYGRKKLK